MFKNLYILRFRNVFVMVSCLGLAGCFKSVPMPNPQVEDTIIEVHECCSVNDKTEENAVKTQTDLINGDYTASDVVAQIFFAFDSSRLSERDEIELNNVVQMQQEDISKHVYIFGYADWRGAEDYNDRLSMRRAEAVANYLRSKGVATEKIHTIALGNLHATSDLSKPDSIRDRRCDIVIW